MTPELVLLILILGLAAVPFRRLLGRHRAVALSSLLTMVVLAVVGVRLQERQTEDLRAAREVFDKATPIVHDEDGYVGSDACQACHPGEHASWRETYHRSMTQVASPEVVKGDFDRRSIVDRGREYRLERRGDEFWVELVDPDWDWFTNGGQRSPLAAGATAPRVWRQVVMVTGSHDTQVYWLPGHHDDRRLNFFPLVWKIETSRWVPLADAFLKYPESVEYLTLWNRTCSRCHSTNPRTRAKGGSATNTVPMNTAVAELGIACEACHGPGQEHVEANRSPLRRYELHLAGDDRADPTIVNPARLDHERSSEVCGQCHGMAFYSSPLDRIDRDGTPYRPGDDLDDTRVLQDPKDPKQKRYWDEVVRNDPVYLVNHFWNDGMVRVSGRDYSSLRKSACFTKGKVGCLDCHSMHDADPNDLLVRDRTTDQVCMDCHREIAAKPEAHSHHAVGSSGSSCINCHMTEVTYGLLKGIRNHQIASPSVAEQLDIGRPNACTLCHLDRSLAWTQDAMVRFWGGEARELDADQKRYSAAILLALQGDAGQRALIANAMGLAERRAVAGDDWMVPILGHLLDDPYGAVRYVAERSLRRVDGYADFEYDMLAPGEERRTAIAALRERWQARRRPDLIRDATLLQAADGLPLDQELRRLAARRNDLQLALGE
ncbi:MAG: C cytochrome precursor [Planctomycetes bacterium]|nr:C cytochrome precursor [Planctomycetota bacterium]